MSILDALRQHNSSIDDLAKLPQAMIMQMAQRKEISEDMLAPILSRKAEMMDAVARTKSLQPQSAPPTVMEQMMAKNAQAEQPQAAQMALQGMPPQMPQQMPQQAPEDVGIATQATQPMRMAGGGIIAFSKGDLVDLEDDIDEEDLIAEYADAMRAGEMAMMRQQQPKAEHQNAGVGFRYTEPMPSGGSKGINYQGGKHPYESIVTARAKEFGVDPMLASYILNKETGGMKNPENARSSAGAMGIAQFMPATAKQYGINPDVPEEAAIGMNKHLRHLMGKFNDPKLAAIAYNWGEGNTQKWLNSGADMDKLPKETRKYVASLAQGGEVRHFLNDGYVSNSDDERSAFQQDLIDMFGYSGASDKPPEKSAFTQGVVDYFSKPKNRSGKTAYILNADPSLDNRDVGMKGSKVTPIAQAGLSPEEMMLGSTRAGTWNALNNDQTTGRALPQPAPSYWDKVASQMEQDRAANIKQKSEDRNMALLTAGLGMIGGSSQHAGENIGKGALAGVQYLSEANKLRGSEKAALDKNALIAQRYKELGEAAKGNQAGLMAIRQGELDVHQGTLANNQKKLLEGSLDRMDKAAAASANAWIKANPMAGFSLENASDIEHVKNQILAKNKRYNTVYQQLEGAPFEYDTGAPAGGGNVQRYDKNGKLIK